MLTKYLAVLVLLVIENFPISRAYDSNNDLYTEPNAINTTTYNYTEQYVDPTSESAFLTTENYVFQNATISSDITTKQYSESYQYEIDDVTFIQREETTISNLDPFDKSATNEMFTTIINEAATSSSTNYYEATTIDSAYFTDALETDTLNNQTIFYTTIENEMSSLAHVTSTPIFQTTISSSTPRTTTHSLSSSTIMFSSAPLITTSVFKANSTTLSIKTTSSFSSSTQSSPTILASTSIRNSNFKSSTLSVISTSDFIKTSTNILNSSQALRTTSKMNSLPFQTGSPSNTTISLLPKSSTSIDMISTSSLNSSNMTSTINSTMPSVFTKHQNNTLISNATNTVSSDMSSTLRAITASLNLSIPFTSSFISASTTNSWITSKHNTLEISTTRAATSVSSIKTPTTFIQKLTSVTTTRFPISSKATLNTTIYPTTKDANTIANSSNSLNSSAYPNLKSSTHISNITNTSAIDNTETFSTSTLKSTKIFDSSSKNTVRVTATESGITLFPMNNKNTTTSMLINNTMPYHEAFNSTINSSIENITRIADLITKSTLTTTFSTSVKSTPSTSIHSITTKSLISPTFKIISSSTMSTHISTTTFLTSASVSSSLGSKLSTTYRKESTTSTAKTYSTTSIHKTSTKSMTVSTILSSNKSNISTASNKLPVTISMAKNLTTSSTSLANSSMAFFILNLTPINDSVTPTNKLTSNMTTESSTQFLLIKSANIVGNSKSKTSKSSLTKYNEILLLLIIIIDACFLLN